MKTSYFFNHCHIKIGVSCNSCLINNLWRIWNCDGFSMHIYILQRLFVEHELQHRPILIWQWLKEILCPNIVQRSRTLKKTCFCFLHCVPWTSCLFTIGAWELLLGGSGTQPSATLGCLFHPHLTDERLS